MMSAEQRSLLKIFDITTRETAITGIRSSISLRRGSVACKR